jgi:hypothetical protein
MNNIPTDILQKCKDLSLRYTELKNKQKSLEKESEAIKNYLEYILLKYNTNSINAGTFSINRNIITQKRISKEDLPEKLFLQYCHPITYSVMNIKTK